MIPSIFIYFFFLIAIALYSRSKKSSDKALDYFLGNRQLGVIPLAMTTAATYINASSFIGGPGIAYSRGLSWVFLATVQYPVGLLIMGLLGKKLQHLGQQHDLYDLVDYIQLRYRSRLYSKFCALLVAIVLLMGLMLALMGGSRLLEGALSTWGLSYRQTLLIFSLALGIYTLLGGFRAVVLTDILQGAWMLLASLVLLFFLWQQAGGSPGLSRFAAENPALFRADNGGALPLHYTLNFVILVGFGMIVQPINFSRLLAFEKGKSIRKSILISSIVLGLLTFLPHFIGFLGRIVLPNIDAPDQLMGQISQLFRTPQYGLLGSIFSGILVSAMLAAIMSTADSTLNVLGLTIYRHLLPKSLSGFFASRSNMQENAREISQKTSMTSLRELHERHHFQLSRLLAGLAIVLMALLALYPPRWLVSLNLYALGITQVTLLWPVVLGLFLRRPGIEAAFAGSLSGLFSYALLNWFFPNFGGVALLPYSLLIGLTAYFAACFATYYIRKKFLPKSS